MTKGNVAGFAEHPEMRMQGLSQPVQGREIPATFREAAKPLRARGELGEPGIRRGKNQQPTRNETLVDSGEKKPGVFQSIDEISGKDQVIAGKLRWQGQGVGRKKLYPLADTVEIIVGQAPFNVGHQLSLQGIS